MFAGVYDIVVKIVPLWKRWIKQSIPHIRGPRVLEASFGTGYLLTQYAGEFETYGIDYNEKMVSVARKNLERKDVAASIQRGDVEALPYETEIFDSIVCTMAFTGYPDGMKAMSELHRVLKKGGWLILVDIDYPANSNRLGTTIAKSFAALGDIIRDMDRIFQAFGFGYTDREIGGFGSIHLYVAQRSR